MSPWTILEWVSSVGLSVIITVAIIFGIGIGTRYLIGITSNSDWFKSKK
jgi:hypothetical protein